MDVETSTQWQNPFSLTTWTSRIVTSVFGTNLRSGSRRLTLMADSMTTLIRNEDNVHARPGKKESPDDDTASGTSTITSFKTCKLSSPTSAIPILTTASTRVYTHRNNDSSQSLATVSSVGDWIEDYCQMYSDSAPGFEGALGTSPKRQLTREESGESPSQDGKVNG